MPLNNTKPEGLKLYWTDEKGEKNYIPWGIFFQAANETWPEVQEEIDKDFLRKIRKAMTK